MSRRPKRTTIQNRKTAAPAPAAARPALVLSTERPPREQFTLNGRTFELLWRDELDPVHTIRAEQISPRAQALAQALAAGVKLDDQAKAEWCDLVREMSEYITTAPLELIKKLTDRQCLELVGRFGELNLERDAAIGKG